MQPRIPPILRPEHPEPRALSEFAERFQLATRGEISGVEVSGITLSTADLRPGDVYVAIHGARRHGAEFAAEAAAAGAVAMVTDESGAELARDVDLPLLIVEDPRAVLAEHAAWIYGNEGRLPLMLGVTGTNGKTSTTHLLAGILRQLGVTPGLSSSAERHIGDRIITSRLTTPESSELHALFAVMREQGVEAIALEVSVQGLMRHRVDGIVFDVAAFTNLSYDHMDDFGDMDEYLEAKLVMFRADRARRAVVSLDSVAGREVVDRAEVPLTTIGMPEIAEDPALAATADWQLEMREETASFTSFTLTGPGGRSLTTRLSAIGPHMASDGGLAIVMLIEAGYSWDDIVRVLDRDGGIVAFLPGRAELVTTGRGPVVYLDFAHSPDSFEKTIAAVGRVTPGRLLTMFGADGSRDKTKRPAMGMHAALGSDIAIVTDHHPRWEDAAEIRAGLYSGAIQARPDGEIYEITPPEDAIVKAVSLVGEGDAILWIGPGHQDFREIQGVRYPYAPRELALDALRKAGW